MKIRNLITTGLMVAGFATMAQAQSYYGGGYTPGPVGRDLHQRSASIARVEADRRAVEHERWEMNHSRGFVARRDPARHPQVWLVWPASSDPTSPACLVCPV